MFGSESRSGDSTPRPLPSDQTIPEQQITDILSLIFTADTNNPANETNQMEEVIQSTPPQSSSKMFEATISRKVPTLDVKLSGASTYPEWIISIENYLDLIPVNNKYRI